MTTYCECLAPTLSNPNAAIDWTPGMYPGTGLLVIKGKRCCCQYIVTEFPCEWDGRAVRMRKVAGQVGSDKEAECYDVFVARNGQDRRCDCKGFEFKGQCKHVLSMLALLENGWLDLSPANPEQDMANTEVHDQPDPFA